MSSPQFKSCTPSQMSREAFVSTFGDVDCFGTGFVCSDGYFGSGTAADLTAFTGAMVADATGPVTDSFLLKDSESWSHNVVLAGTETFASLEFRSYALVDDTEPFTVFVNGNLVGSIPLIVTGDQWTEQQITTYSFDFDIGHLVAGANTIELVKENLLGKRDTWALDYSQITVSEVPIPPALWLLGSALLALAGFRRRA